MLWNEKKETTPEVNIRPRKLIVRVISDHSSNMVQLTRLVVLSTTVNHIRLT